MSSIGNAPGGSLSQEYGTGITDEVTDVKASASHRRTSPLVDSRDLRRRFLLARHEAGFATRKAAADALGFSLRKLDLIETGERSLLGRDLDRVFEAYEVPAGEQAEWRRLAESARAKGWWDRLTTADASPGAKRWAAYEWGARSIRGYSGPVVPGLLQTDAYTEAMFEAGLSTRSPEERRRFAALKALRRTVLDPPDPLGYHVVFDESVLHRVVAPPLMADQVAHIVEVVASHPDVTVQVVPFSAGLFPNIASVFTLVDFGIDGDDGLVNLEPDLASSVYVDDFAQVAKYSRIFETMVREVAASPSDTVAMLRRSHGTLRKGRRG